MNLPSATAAPLSLVEHIRAEFSEMPGLCLTRAQAIRFFGAGPAQTERALHELVSAGFLVRGMKGYRRVSVIDASRPASASHAGHDSSRPDLMDEIGIELPCVVCDDPYRVSLRKIRLSQKMLDDGCSTRHFADCLPAAVAHLVNPDVLAAFDQAARQVAIAAAGAGGRLVTAHDRPPDGRTR